MMNKKFTPKLMKIKFLAKLEFFFPFFKSAKPYASFNPGSHQYVAGQVETKNGG